MKRFAFIKKTLIASLLLLISSNISAYDFEVDGFYYNIETIEDLTCIITFGDEKYSGDIVLPKEVVYNGRTLKVLSVGDYTFENCTGLTSLTIPNTINRIGNNAFNGCEALREIIIEDGNNVLSLGSRDYGYAAGYPLFFEVPLEVLYLGRNVAYPYSYFNYSPFGISSLSEVKIGALVTRLNKDMFNNCAGLKSLTIPNTVMSIEEGVFRGCVNLQHIYIEDGNEILKLGCNNYSRGNVAAGQGLFYDCPIETLYLGRDIDYGDDVHYGFSPFYNRTKLTEINISQNVTGIGKHAFDSCTGLKNVTLPNTVTEIGDSAFYGCKELTNINIPIGIKSINEATFSGCSNLANITFPNSITSIGNDAFSGCEKLTNVTFPNSVIFIGRYAFSGCKGLTSIIIPATVKTILGDPFSNCSIKTLIIEDGDDGLYGETICSRNPLDSVYFGRPQGQYIKISGLSVGGNNSLRSVTIGRNISSLVKNMFGGSNISTIYVLNPIPPTDFENVSFTTQQYLNTITVYVPKGSLAAYLSADGWRNFFNIKEMDTSTGVNNIQIADNVVEVARYSIDGKRLSAPQKGINIVEMSDGSRQKVLVK